jgi:hypothetical protein
MMALAAAMRKLLRHLTYWPQDIYSLAHVALPFRADDPVYGATPTAHWDFMFFSSG